MKNKYFDILYIFIIYKGAKMGYSFNIQKFFSLSQTPVTRVYSPTLYGIKTQDKIQDSFQPAVPSFGTIQKSSLFDMLCLISSIKTQIKTYEATQPVKEEPKQKIVYDSTVMQNYGIVCPKAKEQDEEVKLIQVEQNYGIVCPKDTKKEEPECRVGQNYGIVLRSDGEESQSPLKKAISQISQLKISEGLTAMQNYGIVCPYDAVSLNNYPNLQ